MNPLQMLSKINEDIREAKKNQQPPLVKPAIVTEADNFPKGAIQMASFKSILSDIGKGLKVFFTDATKVAQVAEPIIDMAFPGIATLYNSGVNEVVAIETASIAAGSQSGTGAQKLAAVLSSQAFQTAVVQFEATAGIKLSAAEQTAFINAIVAMLNSIPSSTTTTA